MTKTEKPKKMGRPPKAAADVRRRVVRATVTDAEYRGCLDAAKRAGESLSTWARAVLAVAARV
jgi:hypothetical protein